MKQPEYPEVTIAIVFFNAMPHFPLAVHSVLCQSFTRFELILLDDGSTDGSLEFAKSIADSRVRVVSDGRNLKLNIRLNQTVTMARGKYYFRMDADDVMVPHRVEEQLKVLRAHDENTVVGSSAIHIDNLNNITGLRAAKLSPRNTYEARHAFIHPSVAASTAWFRRNPYSNEFVFHRSQDAELWVRTYNDSHFISIPRPLVFYRDPGQIKVENYIGTSLGLTIIALRQSPKSTIFATSWAAIELFKCWMTITLSLYGLTHLLVSRRKKALSAAQRNEYKALLQDLEKGSSALSAREAAV